MFGVFRVRTPRRLVWFINFRVKNPRNFKRNIFRKKKGTNKVQLMFLDAKVFTEDEVQNTAIITYLERKKQ